MSDLPHIGDFPAGPRGTISDVVGVTVGTAVALRPQDEQPYAPTVVDLRVP